MPSVLLVRVSLSDHVHREFLHPTYDDFKDRTAWSLFNAFTHVLAGRVAGNPRATQNLHNVIDGVCEQVA